MRKFYVGVAALVATMWASSASALVFTTSDSFSGDLCATDGNGSNGFNDCSTIVGNTGTTGIYRFTLDNLNQQPISDVTIRLTSASADLFNTNGTDNSGERFRLFVGGQNFGRLFDGNGADETAINAELGASVQQNIASNIARPVSNRSAGPLDVSFDITSTLFLSLLSNDSLFVDLDFREDQNINAFFNPEVSVSFEVAPVPLPASAFLLLTGVAGLFGVRKLKKA